jgi:hypothetical protein
VDYKANALNLQLLLKITSLLGNCSNSSGSSSSSSDTVSSGLEGEQAESFSASVPENKPA